MFEDRVLLKAGRYEWVVPLKDMLFAAKYLYRLSDQIPSVELIKDNRAPDSHT